MESTPGQECGVRALPHAAERCSHALREQRRSVYTTSRKLREQSVKLVQVSRALLLCSWRATDLRAQPSLSVPQPQERQEERRPLPDDPMDRQRHRQELRARALRLMEQSRQQVERIKRLQRDTRRLLAQFFGHACQK